MEIEEILGRAIPVQQLSVNGKIKLIAHHFEKIMRILELDMDNGSLKDTPERVAKMYVKEIFSGLNPANEPQVTLFEKEYNYDEIILERNIPVYSYCEHHFVPIIGKAHVAYIAKGKIAGLSKLNRVVNYFSRRPQVQERLTFDIAGFLKAKLCTEDVAVIIEAEHLCIASRGIKDAGSTTITGSYHGRLAAEKKNELMQLLKL
ncbi:GTP cyclohydrolase I FolE [Agriterribacter sp.]|uniref:GTP cyclohydrolase I FolE n=1 Tax=Agriterribacter sp. TaxID=2821509 RepID=UPI002B5071DB|nr:GTP cyclohydrolase I FolE [Agriterribacter sp.]HTN07894.1 GTP cyclohydrolase I FolE [Agriterribacter sp.]